MYKYTYPFQLAFVHSDLTSLQCKEFMQNFSPVAIDIFPPNVLVRFISNTQDFSSPPLENVNWKVVVLLRDLSEISRGEGGRGAVGILNLGSEMRWPIPAMGGKFAYPPLDLGLQYHDPPPLV